MGAHNYKRIDKVLLECLALVSAIGLIMGIGAYLLGHLLSIYTTEAEVVAFGLQRMVLVCVPYFCAASWMYWRAVFAGLGIPSCRWWCRLPGVLVPDRLDLYHFPMAAYSI